MYHFNFCQKNAIWHLMFIPLGTAKCKLLTEAEGKKQDYWLKLSKHIGWSFTDNKPKVWQVITSSALKNLHYFWCQQLILHLSVQNSTLLCRIPLVLSVRPSVLTCAGDHGDGPAATLATSFGLNELCATEEGVSPLRLWTVRPVTSRKRGFQHRDALTWKMRSTLRCANPFFFKTDAWFFVSFSAYKADLLSSN